MVMTTMSSTAERPFDMRLVGEEVLRAVAEGPLEVVLRVVVEDAAEGARSRDTYTYSDPFMSLRHR